MFFTRSRFNSYRTNKRLLIIFLLIVNAYVYQDVMEGLRNEWDRFMQPRIIIIEREQSSGDEPSNAHHEAPGADGSSAPAGELEEEAEQSASISIEDKIRQTFPEEPEVMVAIAKAESKLNPHVVNRANTDGSVDVGIFQVNSIHGYDEEFLKNEDNNLKVARQIYEKQGKNAWVAYWNGAYEQWL